MYEYAKENITAKETAPSERTWLFQAHGYESWTQRFKQAPK
jgi:hypothetical protein